jgi:hypothetical protein
MRTLFWLGLGAAAMYLLDPEQGRRRRALARDKMIKARRVVRERASGTARHLGNRAQGLAHEIETPEGAHHLGR